MTGPERDAVVVPAISTASSLACVRSLGNQGVRPIAVSEDPAPPSAHSNHCGEWQRVPSPWDGLSAYRDELVALAERPAVKTVVPLREPDVYVLSRDRESFADHVATPWPDAETVRTAQDRVRLLEVAESVDVPTPASAPVDEWDGWEETTVVKPRYSIVVEDDVPRCPGVQFVGDTDEPDVDDLTESMGHVPLAQEYVPGDGEYGFFALYDEGDPVVTFQHHRVRSYDYAGGASVYRRSVYDPELQSLGTRLLDELEWHGPAMVEFKRDARDGEFELMEINPRFWGSLSLAVEAGVDFPYRYFQLAANDGVTTERDVGSSGLTGPDASDDPPYDVDVGCHVLHGELSYLYSVLRAEHSHVEAPPLARESARVASSLLAEPRFDYLSLDDPDPFVAVFGEHGRDAGSRLWRWFRGDVVPHRRPAFTRR